MQANRELPDKQERGIWPPHRRWRRPGWSVMRSDVQRQWLRVGQWRPVAKCTCLHQDNTASILVRKVNLWLAERQPAPVSAAHLLWMSCSHTWRATALTMAWDWRSPWGRQKADSWTPATAQPAAGPPGQSWDLTHCCHWALRCWAAGGMAHRHTETVRAPTRACKAPESPR